MREGEPVPPRSLNPAVPADLETICLKCLHRDPGRRYVEGFHLQMDLLAFLHGWPLYSAPRAGGWRRLFRWPRRR
jgi:hypothetical protein